MKKIISTAILSLALLGCQNQGQNNVPPGCNQLGSGGLSCTTPFPGSDNCCEATSGGYVCWQDGQYSNAPGGVPSLCSGSPFDPSGGSSGAAGSTSTSGGSTAAEPWCTQDCPDDGDGVCPGHAEWDRGIMIWPLHRPNDSNGQPNSSSPASVTHQDPVCAPSLSICVPYMHPDDIPGMQADMDFEQLQACQALSMSELANLGLGDTTIGQNGWSLIGHYCTQGSSLNVDFEGQSFGVNATQAQSSCLGPWHYEGSCSSSSCPESMDGDTGNVDSSGDSGETGLDCSPLFGSDVDVQKRTSPRTVTVRGSAATMLANDPYGVLFFCSDAKIDDNAVIHDLPRGSLFSDMGLVEDDKIHEVDGVQGSGMGTAFAEAVSLQKKFDVVILRGAKKISYELEVIVP